MSPPAPSRAVFAGVARDCAIHLPGVLATLGRFAASYAEAAFVFVVSDSADDSLSILQRWLSDARHGGRRGKVIDSSALVSPSLHARSKSYTWSLAARPVAPFCASRKSWILLPR